MMTPRQIAVIAYLTAHRTATLKEMADMLECPERDGMLCLGMMIDAGQLVRAEGNRTRWALSDIPDQFWPAGIGKVTIGRLNDKRTNGQSAAYTRQTKDWRFDNGLRC